jgi:hypothetical protein
MKQLIGLVHLGALTALYVALYGAHRQHRQQSQLIIVIVKNQIARLNQTASWFCWAWTEPSLHEK